MKKAYKAFTLIELIASIAVISILATILIPAINRVRTSAQETKCLSNIRTLGMALIICAQNEDQQWPYGYEPGAFWNQRLAEYLGSPQKESLFFCPSETVKATSDTVVRTRTNYISNRRIFADGQRRSDGSTPDKIHIHSITRPSEVALLFDGAVNASGHSDYGIWRQTGFDKSSPLDAEKIVPDDASSGGNNACISWRHGGKTHVVFADGHAASVRLGDLKYKNLQIAY